MIPELTIIVPTLNERDNISPLVSKLYNSLIGIQWEVIFVDDDSTDGTLEILEQLAQSNERVRYIRRIGRRGLSSACLEGMSASSAPFMAIMDGDLQHDEKLLPAMLEKLHTNQYDLAVAVRSKHDHAPPDRPFIRRKLSQGGIWLAAVLLNVPISDSLSGFFMLTRELFERTKHKVSGKGFKILLDIFVSASGDVRFIELPFVFRMRHAGESKLDSLVIWEYASFLLDKWWQRLQP